MKRTIEILLRLVAPPVRTVALLLAVCAAGGAWADTPSLLNYMSFDNTDNKGVVIQKDAGTIDTVKIDGDYVYYTTDNAKFGNYAYQANDGTIGLQDNDSGLVSNDDGWTISFWFYPNGTDNWRSFFGFGLLDGSNYLFLKAGASSFELRPNSESENPTTDTESLGAPIVYATFTASAWNHVAIVCQPRDGEAETVSSALYVNGTLAGSFTMPAATSLREVLLRIGRNNAGDNSAFYRNGYGKQSTWFDDFALFGGALTPSAVKAIAMGADTALGLYNAGELNFSRSINVNFYYMYNNSYAYTAVSMDNSGAAASNASSEGYGPYSVTGTYWSDVLATSTAAQSVKVFDGSTTSDSTVTATISGANGGYFTQSSFDHHIMSGYISDSSSKLEPTVTFANIPFASYRVVLYFAVSGGSASKKYGYVTLNDTINVAGNGSTTIYGDGGATGWGGAAVASNSKNNILLGQNTLVSPVIANNASGTLKVKSHALYSGNTATYYAGLAAIQIVEATPNATTGTYTFSPAADTTTVITSSSNWDNLPTGKGEDITISISGDTTVNVDRDMAFGTITIASTSESAATLTFTGPCLINATQVSVPANVTVKYASSVSGGAPIINAPVVLNNATAALEIAAPATMANAISGSGKVVVSANAVTFATANTFTGGLKVAAGGLAKSSNAAGYGLSATTVVVESGGTLDISGDYSAGYKLSVTGTGVGDNGAVVNTGTATMYDGGKLLNELAITGDATIDCSNSWGISGSKNLLLNGHTLTITATSLDGKFFAHGIYHCAGASTSDTSSTAAIIVSGGTYYTANGNDTKGAVNMTVQAAAKLHVASSYGGLTLSSLTCAGNTTVDSGRTLTVNGTLNVTGAIGVSGTMVCKGNMTGSPKAITIYSNGLFKLANTSSNNTTWTDDASDIFTGEGTLELENGNYGNNTEYTVGTSSFSGKLKLTRNSNSAGGRYLAFVPTGAQENDVMFIREPELELAGAYPGLALGAPFASKCLSVKNLTATATVAADVRPDWGGGDTDPVKTIKTRQTKNTIFNGTFAGGQNKRNSALIVVGDTGSDVYSFTLTGASTTYGGLTVQENAKVVLTATGSWANGTVTVADGGYLEVNNPNTVASKLDLQSGGTIKIATATTTENDEEVTAVVGITAGTVTFPDSGEAVIDVSAIPDLATDEEVTIITATTSLDTDIAKLRLVGKPYSLTRDGNALKVVNDGGLVWTSANSWGGKDVTKYGEATITSPGTVALDGTSLAFDTLTIGGSGTVSFSRTGDETLTVNSLSIASGVTLTAFSGLNLDGATVSMAGTSAYDTSAMIVVPDGVTLAMDGTTVNGNGYTRIIVQSGGTLELTNVTCTAKIYAQNGANVKTYGNCVLNSTAWHLFEYGSTLTVESGNTQLQAEGGGTGLCGKIIIKAGATFTNTNTDALKYSASVSEKTEVELWGTLAMGSSRWTLGANNLITLHDGAEITGAGQNASDGALDWYGSGTLTAVGNAEIKARIKVRSGISPTFNVSDGKVLTLSTYDFASNFAGSITKAGDGMLKLNKIGLPVLRGSEGTVLSYNDSTSHVNHSAASVTFTGKIDFVSEGRHGHLIENNFSLAANSRPQLAINTKKVNVANNDSYGYLFFNSGWNNKTLAVRDLIGEGRVCMKASGSVAQTTTIETMQTQNTEFSGIFICNDGATEQAHLANLSIIGDGSGTLHSLTLSGANTSIGQLSVNDNAKVIFADNGSVKGSWAAGSVSVGATGFIQSESTASCLAATLTLQDGATVVRGSQPVKATALTALDANATIKIAFADGVTPEDGMVVLSGTWADAPDAARFAFARSSYSDVYEFVVTDSGVVINEIETSVTVGGTEISVGNSWLLAAMQKSYDSGVLPTDMSVATVYLTNNGLNGMPRAVSYLLGLENPDDATTAFVMESASVSSGEGNTPVLTFTGKSYSTDRATVTYKVFGGDSPDSMSEVTPDSNSGNVITVTVPSNATVKYYQLKMTVTPN